MRDFSLHSIGVLLFRNKKEKVFAKFAGDILPKIPILKRSKENYKEVATISTTYNLDFDDSYQTFLSIDKQLEIVTMDNDFKKVEEIAQIKFLK